METTMKDIRTVRDEAMTLAETTLEACEAPMESEEFKAAWKAYSSAVDAAEAEFAAAIRTLPRSEQRKYHAAQAADRADADV